MCKYLSCHDNVMVSLTIIITLLFIVLAIYGYANKIPGNTAGCVVVCRKGWCNWLAPTYFTY